VYILVEFVAAHNCTLTLRSSNWNCQMNGCLNSKQLEPKLRIELLGCKFLFCFLRYTTLLGKFSNRAKKRRYDSFYSVYVYKQWG
jgi:hypothetical protein